MHGLLLLLHLLGATVWTGGHLVLALAILPGVLRDRAPERLLAFESRYERIGMPALVVQVVTGLWLAHRLLPGFRQWLEVGNPVTRLVLAKLLLLLLTLSLAASARLRLLPRLDAQKLPALAWHIAGVTLLSVLFVVVGLSFRTGWLY